MTGGATRWALALRRRMFLPDVRDDMMAQEHMLAWAHQINLCADSDPDSGALVLAPPRQDVRPPGGRRLDADELGPDV